jgi:hypothetical protein
LPQTQARAFLLLCLNNGKSYQKGYQNATKPQKLKKELSTASQVIEVFMTLK